MLAESDTGDSAVVQRLPPTAHSVWSPLRRPDATSYTESAVGQPSLLLLPADI